MSRESLMKTDRVCVRFARRKTRLTVRKLDRDTVLIEGNRAGLEFLGKLLMAQAAETLCCHNHISPKGPGSVFFTRKAKLGLYLHRVPCKEGSIR
jgi:hypothetical protein